MRSLGLAIVAVAMTACSAGAGTHGQSQYRQPTLKSVSPAFENQTLPFDRYSIGYEGLADIQRAEVRDLTQCLLDQGIRLPSTLSFAGDYYRPLDASSSNLLWGGPLGTMSLAQARDHGFHAGPDDPFSLGSGLYIRSLDNLSLSGSASSGTRTAADKALNESGGCREREASRLGHVVEPTQVELDVMNLAYNHPQVGARMKLWAMCMADAGYPEYSSVNDPPSGVALREVAAHEVRVATANVKCMHKSKWPDYFYTALADYESQAIRNDPNTFTNELASEQAILKRAGAVN